MASRYVCTEGATDREVLRAALRGLAFEADVEVTPGKPKPCTQPLSRSLEGDVQAIRLGLELAQGKRAPRVDICLDLDDRTEPEVYGQVEAAAREHRLLLEAIGSPPNGWYRLGPVTLRVVCMGAPGQTALVALGVDRPAAEDHVLALLLQPVAFTAFAEGERRPPRGLEESLSRLQAILGALATAGAPPRTSKEVLRLLLVTMRFGAALPTLAEKLLNRAPRPLVDAQLSGLRAALAEAPPR